MLHTGLGRKPKINLDLLIDDLSIYTKVTCYHLHFTNISHTFGMPLHSQRANVVRDIVGYCDRTMDNLSNFKFLLDINKFGYLDFTS